MPAMNFSIGTIRFFITLLQPDTIYKPETAL